MNYAKYELRSGIAGIEIGSFEKVKKTLFEVCKRFSGEYFDILDKGIILNSIKVYEDNKYFFKSVEYVIISNNDSTKIRIIQNSRYGDYQIVYTCLID